LCGPIMRYAAGAFNDKTPSLRAGGFTMRSHVIESSLYRHARLLRAGTAATAQCRAK